MEEKKNVEYCYRYFLKVVEASGEERFVAITYCGTEEVQSAYLSSLLDRADLISAGREYVCEYDYDLIGKFEPIKSEKKTFEEDSREDTPESLEEKK
ncbi:hypothetical protein [Dipodfec virus UOA04_Rod_682]|nr:hypothetical protein [Dipodfec virus UOA04_Rod_682]